MTSRRFMRCLLCAFVGLASVAPAGAASDYLLGPQDKLRIKVYDWRTGQSDAHEWPALNGEYVVGSSGSVSLPLIGEVPAAGITPSSLAHAVVKLLQDKVGLAQRPDAAVEVLEYRPFYILGLVEKSGEYAYRPGLTVLQAVSLAGGIVRTSDQSLIGVEREAIVNHGDLQVLLAERDGLAVRKTRLAAEIAGAPSVDFGPDLLARKDVPRISQAMSEEQSIFAAYRDEQATESALLMKSRDLIAREIDVLVAKDATLGHQYDVAKKELDTVSALVTRGMAVVPRELALEQNASQFQSNRLDVQLSRMRAQQDISKIDQNLSELKTKRRVLALSEANETGARLAALNAKIATAERLIDQAEMRSPDLIQDLDRPVRRAPVYTLSRTVDGVVSTKTVDDSDAVQPGDTIRVDRGLPAKTLASQ